MPDACAKAFLHEDEEEDSGNVNFSEKKETNTQPRKKKLPPAFLPTTHKKLFFSSIPPFRAPCQGGHRKKRGEEGRGEDAEDGGKEAKDVGGSGDAGPEEEEAVGDATKEKLCRKKRRRKVRQNHVTTATARTTNGNENRRGDRE